MDFNYYMPVEILSGDCPIVEHRQRLSQLGKQCLILTGGSSAQRNGALDDALRALEQEQIHYTVYDRVRPNPLLSSCYEAGALARQTGADFLLGIGGGSALDSAKAAALFAAHPQWEPADLFSAGPACEGIPLALMGTTAGTGSEVTAISVLTLDESGRKKSIRTKGCYARLAFACPRYTFTAPREITVSTALDAFSHAVEAFLSPRLGEVGSLYATRALPLLWEGLQELLSQELPNPEMREQLYYASLYAGMEINVCGTSFPHALGYVLTEDFGIPHGRACTAFLPGLVRLAQTAAPQRARTLFQILQTDEAAFRHTMDTLTAVHLSMTKSQIARYCLRWAQCKNFDNVPGGYDADQAAALLESLFLKKN